VFPQELDDEYLIIWHGFEEKGWDYLDEDELREFLIDRCGENYVFPINPIWMIRDADWWDVYEAMISTQQGKDFIAHYFGPCEGVDITEKLTEIHELYSEGFLAHGTGAGSSSRKSMALDMEAGERMGLALTDILEGHEVRHDPGEDLDTEVQVMTSFALGDYSEASENDDSYLTEIRSSLLNSGMHSDLLSGHADGQNNSASLLNTSSSRGRASQRLGMPAKDVTGKPNKKKSAVDFSIQPVAEEDEGPESRGGSTGKKSD